MRVVYSPSYRVDLGRHVFPTQKYQLVHAKLLETGIIVPSDSGHYRTGGAALSSASITHGIT